MKVNKWEQMQSPGDTDDSHKRKKQGLDSKEHQRLKDRLKKEGAQQRTLKGKCCCSQEGRK